MSMSREEYVSYGYAAPECSNDELELLSIVAFKLLDALSCGGLADILGGRSKDMRRTARIAIAAQIFSMLRENDGTICRRSMLLMERLGIYPAERT